MPYINKDARAEIDKTGLAQNAGELNFVITKVLLAYIDMEGLSYRTLNEVIGVLECVKQELYRRMIVGYEDQKIAENGDVYP